MKMLKTIKAVKGCKWKLMNILRYLKFQNQWNFFNPKISSIYTVHVCGKLENSVIKWSKTWQKAGKDGRK